MGVLRDGVLTDPLPIWCWVIERDGGVVLVDVGPVTSIVERSLVDLGARLLVDLDGFELEPADELHEQLESIGIEPAAVETIVLTHLHFDHASDLTRFPNAHVLVSRREYWTYRLLPLGSTVGGWPGAESRTMHGYGDGPVGPFSRSHRVTPEGDVRIVPTPGHTPGHQSVIVRDGDELLFLAGDATFTEGQLLADEVVGISLNARTSRATMARIRSLCARERVVYLPSHDRLARERLESRTPTTVDEPR